MSIKEKNLLDMANSIWGKPIATRAMDGSRRTFESKIGIKEISIMSLTDACLDYKFAVDEIVESEPQNKNKWKHSSAAMTFIGELRWYRFTGRHTKKLLDHLEKETLETIASGDNERWQQLYKLISETPMKLHLRAAEAAANQKAWVDAHRGWKLISVSGVGIPDKYIDDEENDEYLCEAVAEKEIKIASLLEKHFGDHDGSLEIEEGSYWDCGKRVPNYYGGSFWVPPHSSETFEAFKKECEWNVEIVDEEDDE